MPFVERWKPRHDGVDDLIVRRAALQIGRVMEASSNTPKRKRGVSSLYEAYYRSKPDLFVQDLQRRPEHYDEQCIRTIRALQRGDKVPEAEITELILRHQRPSAQKKAPPSESRAPKKSPTTSTPQHHAPAGGKVRRLLI